MRSSSVHVHTQTPTSLWEKSIFTSSIHKSLHSTVESNDFRLLIFQTIPKSPTPGHEIKFVPSLKTATADHKNKINGYSDPRWWFYEGGGVRESWPKFNQVWSLVFSLSPLLLLTNVRRIDIPCLTSWSALKLEGGKSKMHPCSSWAAQKAGLLCCHHSWLFTLWAPKSQCWPLKSIYFKPSLHQFWELSDQRTSHSSPCLFKSWIMCCSENATRLSEH